MNPWEDSSPSLTSTKAASNRSVAIAAKGARNSSDRGGNLPSRLNERLFQFEPDEELIFNNEDGTRHRCSPLEDNISSGNWPAGKYCPYTDNACH